MTPRDWFLSHGVNVFPIKAGTKQPATNGASWQGWTLPVTTAAYGVELGSLIVIDGDSARSTAWIRQHCPPTPFRVQSGPHHDGSSGRGVHFYYRSPSVVLPAFITRDGLAIEVRRTGQYVVGPDSPHPSRCTYRASDWSWAWKDIPVLPGDFVFSDGSGLARRIGEPYSPPTAPIARGQRTDELFRLVRHLKANGSTRETTLMVVEMYNRNFCDPPKEAAWIRSWFGRAWRHRDQPGFGHPPVLFTQEDGL